MIPVNEPTKISKSHFKLVIYCRNFQTVCLRETVHKFFLKEQSLMYGTLNRHFDNFTTVRLIEQYA